LLGTTQGAASDLDGYYAILNVKPGTYSLKASAIGYGAMTVSNIRVSIDLTSKVDFTLAESAVQLAKEVVVIAEKPIVTKDLTSSTAIVGAEDIAALPVTEFQEVLQLKAGIVGGTVRGGRRGEVVYAIDGVPMTDVYDGSTVVDVNANSIQELQFVSGAFNAEYGKALSGYVNIATKDGDDKFTGNFSTYVGGYYSTRTNIFRYLDHFKPLNIRNFEGSLSGPLIPDQLYFYTTLRYIYFGGWLYGQRVYNTWDTTVNKGADLPVDQRYNIARTGDGSMVNMNYNEKFYGQFKLTQRLLPEMRLTYNYISDRVNYRDYDHSYSLNPDGDYRRFRWGLTNILGLTHTLGASTFYQLNLSYFFKKYRHFVYEDWRDPRYTNEVLQGQQPSDVPSARTGGEQHQHFKRLTSTYGIKYDITSQVTKIHQIKAGVEFNRHQLSYDDINLLQPAGTRLPKDSHNPYVLLYIPNINDPNENLAINIYQRKPIEFSTYLQDKIELNEMIINIGLRFDYFKSDGYILNDPTDPDIYHPRNPANINKTLAERRTYWYKDPSPKLQFSPRLGVAFPITDRGVIHFSYGHFFQLPNFDLLFQNPEYKFGQGTGNIGIAGNPDLKPQSTVSGEIGLQQALSEDLSVDITGYFRDIRDLAGTRADEITMFGGSSRYSQIVNSDFGFVKGIVITLTKRLSNNWSATIDYTLQSAKGNASDPSTTWAQITNGQQPEIQLIRLDQDQSHTLNVTFSYNSPDYWGFSLIGSFGSGFPYTPSESINISSLLTNSEIKPSYYNLDLKAYYDVLQDPIKLSLFLRALNVLDVKNQLGVYTDSGSADYTLQEYLDKQRGYPELVNSVDRYYRDPRNYSEPRRIEFGATVNF
jgi:outer membrane receptor protein involved in Fe transport